MANEDSDICSLMERLLDERPLSSKLADTSALSDLINGEPPHPVLASSFPSLVALLDKTLDAESPNDPQWNLVVSVAGLMKHVTDESKLRDAVPVLLKVVDRTHQYEGTKGRWRCGKTTRNFVLQAFNTLNPSTLAPALNKVFSGDNERIAGVAVVLLSGLQFGRDSPLMESLGFALKNRDSAVREFAAEKLRKVKASEPPKPSLATDAPEHTCCSRERKTRRSFEIPSVFRKRVLPTYMPKRCRRQGARHPRTRAGK